MTYPTETVIVAFIGAPTMKAGYSFKTVYTK